MATRGFAGYAFAFVEEEEPARARNLYRRGRDYGLELLSRRAGLEVDRADLESLQQSLERLDRKDVPAPLLDGLQLGKLGEFKSGLPGSPGQPAAGRGPHAPGR